MKTLSPNWITEGLMDAEYKQYVLMAYLQHVSSQFHKVELYPSMADLVFHYNNLLEVKKNHQLIQEQFPKELTKADFENLKLEYKKLIDDNDFMAVLNEVIDYSLPRLRQYLEEGKEIYQLIENNLEIQPVGLQSLNTDEGYLLLIPQPGKTVQIYQYACTIYTQPKETFRAINTTFLEEQKLSYANNIEQVKISIHRTYQTFGMPATFSIEAKIAAPLQPTLLPIVKRSFMRYLYKK